jgi:hypothetical protein
MSGRGRAPWGYDIKQLAVLAGKRSMIFLFRVKHTIGARARIFALAQQISYFACENACCHGANMSLRSAAVKADPAMIA